MRKINEICQKISEEGKKTIIRVDNYFNKLNTQKTLTKGLTTLSTYYFTEEIIIIN